MSIFDHRWLTNATMKLDIDGLRRGIYADKYFENVVQILAALEHEGYVYAGQGARDLPAETAGAAVGNMLVEAQIFNRREPNALVGGVDAALAMLRHVCGYFGEQGEFVETWKSLEVEAVEDGVFTHYAGDPEVVQPVIKIRGRYRDFALLETTILGYLTRASRIATNVYEALRVANGKSVLFFPARFDLPAVQALDGYAYWLAVQRYNADTGRQMQPLVSTDAQGVWWGGRGGGTVPHALIACFFGDTPEAMLAFARHLPIEIPRIGLTDFNNDSVDAALQTLQAFWPHYLDAYRAGDEEGQSRWTLHGVRLDTSGNVRDVSLPPDGPKGVNPELIGVVRAALDHACESWDVPADLAAVAQAYCREVKIVVSGGFDRERIAAYEADAVPVDIYGVGSSFLRNRPGLSADYTMDVVRIELDGVWVDMPKVGRKPCDNPDLQPVDLSIF